MPSLKPTLLCGALLLSAGLAPAADLTILVEDVKSSDGQIMVAVYDTADSFQRQPAGVARVAAVAGTTTVVLKDLPTGRYAVTLYHDANGNGRLDRNPLGMPVEDYAFSNNALGRQGTPEFDSASLPLPAAGASTRISLR